MPDSMDSSLDPNILANMIRQQKLIGTFSGGGLPSPMPVQPDMTVHVHHALGLPDNQPTVPDDLQTGVAPSPTQATPQSTNIPKVGPINPNSTDPAESAYKQALMNEPMHSDYHPSKLRDILSKITAVGVGAFAGGDAGASAGRALRDTPYNQQHNDWAQYAGNKNALATEEAAGNTSAGKAALTQAQIAEQNSLAGLHGQEQNNKVRELQLMRNTPEEVKQDKIDEAQGRLKVDTREAKMLDGTIKHLVQRNGLFYDPETNARIDRSAIEDISDEGKSLKETKDARIPGNLGESVKASKIIAAGVGGKTDDGITVDQATFDAAKDYKAKLDKGSDPKGAFDSIVTQRNRERVAAGKPPMSSNELEALQTKLLSVEKPGGVLMVNPENNQVQKFGPGSTLPNGAQTPQQLGTNEQKSQKELEDLKADQSFVNDYLNNQTHTGPGDEALLERFFNATKPSTGFRMNQAQIALLTKLRSFTGSIKAHIKQLTGGTLFDDDQRKQIVDQINSISNSKIAAHGGKNAQTDTLPGGISIQDIDAEIARRKGGK